MFEHLFNGFVVALIPANLLIALAGCLVGTLIGVLPGLGPTATLAMLTPLVFSMPPAHCNLSCIPFLKTLWGFKSKRNADAA